MTPRRPRVSRATRGAGSDAGFTIIEVVVASTLLVVSFLAAALLFESTTRISGDTRMRVIAAQIASSAIEKVRGPAADPARFTSSIIPGTTVTSQTVNGLKFTLTQEMQWVAQSSTTSACDSGGVGSNGILQVTESVTWTGAGATAPVESVTTLAPPAGAYSAATGSIAAKVLDATGLPQENVQVSISGASSQAQSTTSEGCAFFAYLTPGAYTVKVTAGTGVGDQQDLVPSKNTSVTVGQTASLAFNYDTAARITITGWSGSVATPATNIPIGIGNSSLSPYRMYSYAAGTTALTPLFPQPSGYTVFAGNCTDNNPVGLDTTNNVFYNNPGTTPVSVTPGGTTLATVPLYDLPVKVVNTSGVVQPNAVVTATETTGYASPYTSVCTNGGASGTAPTLGMVTTDAAGTSTTAMPLGHWSIKAVVGTKQGTTKIWRRITGVFAVTTGGASTGSALPVVTVTVA
jgi:Tfp pilus assembly protein PilV